MAVVRWKYFQKPAHNTTSGSTRKYHKSHIRWNVTIITMATPRRLSTSQKR